MRCLVAFLCKGTPFRHLCNGSLGAHPTGTCLPLPAQRDFCIREASSAIVIAASHTDQTGIGCMRCRHRLNLFILKTECIASCVRKTTHSFAQVEGVKGDSCRTASAVIYRANRSDAEANRWAPRRLLKDLHSLATPNLKARRTCPAQTHTVWSTAVCRVPVTAFRVNTA